MPKRTRTVIPVPEWKCPHCGFVHLPADLQRLGFNKLKCKSCEKTFDTAPDGRKTS